MILKVFLNLFKMIKPINDYNSKLFRLFITIRLQVILLYADVEIIFLQLESLLID